jgi:hypothetical protein
MKFVNIPVWEEWKKASSSSGIRSFKPKLARIDNLVQKYHQVMDMSKINILTELKNAIIDWAADKIEREAGTGRLQAMQALEEVVLRKLEEFDGWGRHRYLKVVCIGFEVVTGPYGNQAPLNDKVRRMDEIVDLGNECNSMTGAIKDAFKKYKDYAKDLHLTPDEEHKILKIFVAPEFYFRGRYGAYRDIGMLSKIFSMMRSETGKAVDYSDWLFVLGSAIFATTKTVNLKEVGLLPENFALVQKGGPKTSEHHDFFVEKEFPSHMDFNHPRISDLEWYNPVKSEVRIAGVDKKVFSPEGGRKDPFDNPLGEKTKSLSEMVGGSVFTIDGIRFGLEVCRDHCQHRLAHSQERGTVLIQLIPSCGMAIDLDGVACVHKGLVFNVDGDTPHVMIMVNDAGAVQPAEHGFGLPSNGGFIHLFEAVKIPWPELVNAKVAKYLHVPQGVLSGTAPVIPPRPSKINVNQPQVNNPAPPPVQPKVVPPRPVPAKPGPHPLPSSVKKFGIQIIPPPNVKKN